MTDDRTPRKPVAEPMIRFNGSGYGLKWSTVLQALVLIVAGALAWASIQHQLTTLTKGQAELKLAVETARKEWRDDIDALEERTYKVETDEALVKQRVFSLESLMKEIRDSLRKRG